MWNQKQNRDDSLKCSRSDCKHYQLLPAENPCEHCTCSYKSSSLCKSFEYRHKDDDTRIMHGGKR